MSHLQDIQDIFSIFHDGVIESWQEGYNLLFLTIQCQYLAERIDPHYNKFIVELHHINKLYLDIWSNPIDLPSQRLTDPKDIFKADLDILSATIQDESVCISCNQDDASLDYCGGNLYISCKKIKVYDQNNKEISIDQLKEISNTYWSEFSRKFSG